MIRRRSSPDGLPYRVYVSRGKRVISYYYKHRDNTREQISRARVVDKEACAEARKLAIRRGVEINEGAPQENTVALLFADYFAWQYGLAESDERKKAASTLSVNEDEAKKLCTVFGEMLPDEVLAVDVYKYQDLRAAGGAGKKANKEIALMSAVYEYGRARGLCTNNPARGIKRIPSRPKTRCVTWDEICAVRAVAEETPSWTIQALAAATAWLCVRRPPEILVMRRDAIGEDGLRFLAAKRKAGQAERYVVIEWSEALREVIDAALAVKRNKVAGSWYVFGNLAGQRYTRSGWGAMWGRLMARCKEVIEEFEPFTLQDCRPGGVTRKKERGDVDVVDATLHRSSRMIETIYDRRRERRAKPSE